MPNFPCCEKSLCIDPGSPVENLSAEGGDGPSFFGYFWPWIDQNNPIDGGGGGNLPNPTWFAEGCQSICVSSISQEDADLCAQREAFICSRSRGTPPVTFFYNNLQVCNFTCPDGTVYSYRIYAGSFVNTSQSAADEQAAAYACQLAARTNICLGNIDNACLNEPYLQVISLSGRGLPPFVFALIGGSLPPGLSFAQTSSTQATISGTATVSGDYTFRVRVTDARGDFMEKDYTLHVMGISNAAPAGTVGTPYSFQYLVTGGTAPFTFVIDAGSLPTGLTMSDSGLITGTPTTVGTSTFTVSFTDSST